MAKQAGLDAEDADQRLVKREEKAKSKNAAKALHNKKAEFQSMLAGKDVLSQSTYLSPARLNYLNSLGDRGKPAQSSAFVRRKAQKKHKTSLQR